MGSACRTLEKPADGAVPTFWLGLSGVISSGYFASIASSRLRKAS